MALYGRLLTACVLCAGHTYDRLCIERWLAAGNRTCPVTGMRLRHLELTPNFALRNAIQVLTTPTTAAVRCSHHSHGWLASACFLLFHGKAWVLGCEGGGISAVVSQLPFGRVSNRYQHVSG